MKNHEKKMSNVVTKISPLSGDVQGHESFEIEFSDGQKEVIKSWDYTFIYSVPFLYEKLYCDLLDYKAFEVLGEMLLENVSDKFEELRVLDVACGSGLMGKYLKQNSPVKIESLIGSDIIVEATTALQRDYPSIYDKTYTVREKEDFISLHSYSFNCVSISGAANHMQLEEFIKYTTFLNKGGYIVFNLLTQNAKGNRRNDILNWLQKHLIFCDSKLYNHRKLSNGKIIKHEAFLYKK
ncbi:hypothetical protein ACE193_13015 [Bernardetia sp. OM2101]|uniref:hypothetical protein n=1 Tax=Bernardetia sp. OM2101 TaxID=3344876 RepID=UPI0035D0C02F